MEEHTSSSVVFFSFRRELEQRLRELKRKKKEKKLTKLKEFEEEREKDKKRWNDFNSKVRQREVLAAVLIPIGSLSLVN